MNNMNKKYQKPTVKVIEMKYTGPLCESDPEPSDPDNINTSLWDEKNA